MYAADMLEWSWKEDKLGRKDGVGAVVSSESFASNTVSSLHLGWLEGKIWAIIWADRVKLQ